MTQPTEKQIDEMNELLHDAVEVFRKMKKKQHDALIGLHLWTVRYQKLQELLNQQPLDEMNRPGGA